jgi:hypothetical protein
MTGGTPVAAKGATRYDLRAMGDGDFESMVARLILWGAQTQSAT